MHRTVLTLLCVLVGCASKQAGNRAGDDVVAALQAKHPQNVALVSTLSAHREGGSNQPREHLLMTTWFAAPDARAGNWSIVDAQGGVLTHQFIHDYGLSNSRSTQLVDLQLIEIRQLLAQLPPSASPLPPVEDLLLVSYRTTPDAIWQTRVYPRNQPPAQVTKIFEITAAPLGASDIRP